MTHRQAMLGLQWTLGVVVFAEAALVVFSAHAHAAQPLAVPVAVLTAVALAEMVAAALFLIPPTMVIGGTALIVIFALAIVVHVVHGQANVGALLVYAAAAWTVVAASRA
jgi:hypothetical protein